MNIGGYPINPINRINNKLPWVIDQEYKVWYWHTGGKASETPLEPLTQEFWRMKRDSRLVHGLHLPQFDRRYGGDLLILVTQRLDCAIQKDYGGLTIFQRNDLYKLILEVYFIHVTIIRTRPIKEQIEFFQSCERSFEEKILPKKNQHGEYYRGVRKDLPETGALQLNEKGRVNCPNCNFGIGFGSGTMITYQKRTGIETRLIHVKCENCNTQLEIYVDVIPEVQDAKLVEGVTL